MSLSLDTSKFNRDMSFAEAVTAYAWANPEFRDLGRGRAKEVMDEIFRDSGGEILSDREVRSNMEKFKVRVLAIIEQIMNNERAHEALTVAGPDAKAAYASDDDYKRAPRTILKTFQDVLSPTTERFVYEREEDEVVDGDYSNIVIDPANITPTLLRNLGLNEFIPPKRTGMANGDRMAFMAQAIPSIKEMLKHLQPLDIPHKWHNQSKDDYFRLMVITEGPNRGYIIGTQVYTDPSTKKKRKRLFKTDAHGADRRLNHIMEESYKEEIRRIKYIQTTILDVHSRLKKSADMTEDELANIRQNLTECADSLMYVTDEKKVKMYNDIKTCVSLKIGRRVAPKFDWVDAKTREEVRPSKTIEVYNPGAVRAKLIGVPSKGDERIRNISDISGYLGRDKIVTRNFIAEQQMPFENFYKQVEALHHQFAILDLGKPLSYDARKKIVGNLQDLRAKCNPKGSTIRKMPLLEPYLTFGEKMVEHIDKTLEILKSEEDEKMRTAAATEFTKIYLVAKIQKFYVELMDFHEKFTSPNEIPNFDDVLKGIDKLDDLIKSKPVQARATRDFVKSVVMLRTEEYDGVYHHIKNKVTDLRMKAMEAYELSTDNSNQTEKSLKRLKAEMHSIVRNLRLDDLLRTMGNEDESEAA